MERHAGFTLIELLITISIMVILMSLAVVSLRSSQANARDEERKTDVAIIAQQLESYYRSGSDGAAYAAGEYPPTAFMNSEANVKLALRDIDPKTLRAPDVPLTDPLSLTVATSSTAPSPTVSQYIYQPIDRNNALCDQATDYCSKFTIYYKLETNSTVQQLTSKHQ
jgi:prepilin-type N-terminal cleavage/methylation domain-containing protein